MTVKYPTHINVAFIEEFENSVALVKVPKPHLFGVVAKHNPAEKEDAKRKNSQYEQAYRYCDRAGIYRRYPTFFTKDGYLWVKYEVRYGTYKEEAIDADLQPIVYDNVPMTGFKIMESVNRSTNNKVWRILDPRGFVSEIFTKSLGDIIMNSDIHRGQIMSKCIWTGSKSLKVVV